VKKWFISLIGFLLVSPVYGDGFCTKVGHSLASISQKITDELEFTGTDQVTGKRYRLTSAEWRRTKSGRSLLLFAFSAIVFYRSVLSGPPPYQVYDSDPPLMNPFSPATVLLKMEGYEGPVSATMNPDGSVTIMFSEEQAEIRFSMDNPRPQSFLPDSYSR